jgi:hypothetical protein
MKNSINKTTDREGIIGKVMQFVYKTNTVDLETRIHAAKSILYKVYGINVAYTVLEKRFNEHGVHQ